MYKGCCRSARGSHCARWGWRLASVGLMLSKTRKVSKCNEIRCYSKRGDHVISPLHKLVEPTREYCNQHTAHYPDKPIRAQPTITEPQDSRVKKCRQTLGSWSSSPVVLASGRLWLPQATYRLSWMQNNGYGIVQILILRTVTVESVSKSTVLSYCALSTSYYMNFTVLPPFC